MSQNKTAREAHKKILEIIRTEIDNLKKAGYKQHQIARMCGLSQASINRYLSGKQGKNISLLTALTIICNLNLDVSAAFQEPPPLDKEKIKRLLAEIGKVLT